MELNVRQKKVIYAEENKILCLAGAGCTKTYVLTERIKRLVKEGCEPKNIIAITFSNTAAEEMKERLQDIKPGIFIGTVHSLANSICIANGINTERYIIEENFDKIITEALLLPRRFFPKVKHVLVDEFQDICENDFKFIQKIQSENFFAVADERQAIYQFRGGNIKFLYNLYTDADCKTYYLTQNYRCAKNILKFADDLIGSMNKISPNSTAVRAEKGAVEKCNFLDAIDEMEWSQDWGDWFVLCRTNAEITAAIEILEKRNIPYASFKQGDMDLAEMKNLLKENRVKVLTCHTSKGLSSKHVIVTGAKTYNETERKIAYVAATRAEDDLYWTPSVGKKKTIKRKEKKISPEMISFE